MRIKDIKKIEKNIVACVLMSGVLLFAVSMNVTANDISAETVIQELNESRTIAGLAPLGRNNKLTEAAEAKIQNMIDDNYFEHTSPSGLDPWHWIGKSGYAYTYAGENLAMDFRTAEAEQAAWMKSPTHRENILNTHFQEVGVAVRQGMINGHMTTIAVQEFGARKNFYAYSENGRVAGEQIAADGKILGAQNNSLASLSSKLNSILVGGVNRTFAVGAISGWTLILYGIAMSLMGITAVYLAFDIHRIRKEEKMARESHHQNVYHIGEDDYAQILTSLSAKSMKLKNHHS